MEARHLISAVNILRNIHYATLATVCEDGSPWNSPVAASYDADVNIFWGSSPDNVHSQNIQRDGRVFVVIYDSTVPWGTGEGIYMIGIATELDFEPGGVVRKYQFTPEKIWINDEAKNEDGSYKHDVRVELELSALKEVLN